MVRIARNKMNFKSSYSSTFIDNKSLLDPMRVKELRKRVQVNLETYINQQKSFMRGRFGELLLLLPSLQNIARLMVDLVARYSQDTKQVDDLINEMLLSKFISRKREMLIIRKK